MSDTSATCPRCQGAIHPQTMVCPHCGSEVTGPGPASAGDSSPAAAGPAGQDQPSVSLTGLPGSPGEEEHRLAPAGDSGSEELPAADEGPDDEAPLTRGDQAGADRTDEIVQPAARPRPFSLWQQLRETMATLDNAMAWNEVWFFLMWGFLFLTYFLT